MAGKVGMIVIGALVVGGAFGAGAVLYGDRLFMDYDGCVETYVNETESTAAKPILIGACSVLYGEQEASAEERKQARCVLDKVSGASDFVVTAERLTQCGGQ